MNALVWISQNLLFQLKKAMILTIRNSQKHLFELEKQRLCSSGFRRTYFSKSKSNDSVDTEFTEAFFRIRKVKIVLVWILQKVLFQLEKQ